MTDTVLAGVEDLDTLKGQYLRNTRDRRIYQITDVGREGVTVFEVERFGDQAYPYGDEILLTWRLVKRLYAIMVHAGEIDTKELH